MHGHWDFGWFWTMDIQTEGPLVLSLGSLVREMFLEKLA